MQNIADSLRTCGQTRIVSLVVEYLVSDFEPHYMRDIERGSDLRQPEVSKALVGIGNYIEIRNDKTGRLGRRPEKLVQMTRESLGAFINSLKVEVDREYKERSDAIERIRSSFAKN